MAEELASASNRTIALVWRENSVRDEDFRVIGEYITEVMKKHQA